MKIDWSGVVGVLKWVVLRRVIWVRLEPARVRRGRVSSLSAGRVRKVLRVVRV